MHCATSNDAVADCLGRADRTKDCRKRLRDVDNSLANTCEQGTSRQVGSLITTLCLLSLSIFNYSLFRLDASYLSFFQHLFSFWFYECINSNRPDLLNETKYTQALALHNLFSLLEPAVRVCHDCTKHVVN